MTIFGGRKPLSQERCTSVEKVQVVHTNVLPRVFYAADLLAHEPAPEGSFAYGSQAARRVHVGLYRLLCEIFEETGTIRVIRIGRVD